MKMNSRLTLLLGLLAVGLLAQLVMWNHLEAAGPLPEVSLQAPLTELPLEIDGWRGIDRPIEDEKLLYADQHLQRTYVHEETGQLVSLWVVYSREGVDRQHHPEVCMKVAGQPQDHQASQTLEVSGHAAPIQRFRFGRPGSFQQIYYWHYTLQPPARELSKIQRLYQRLRERPSSATLEVFVPEQSERTSELAEEFVRMMDQAVQRQVGPDAIRGSERKPVAVIAAE